MMHCLRLYILHVLIYYTSTVVSLCVSHHPLHKGTSLVDPLLLPGQQEKRKGNLRMWSLPRAWHFLWSCLKSPSFSLKHRSDTGSHSADESTVLASCSSLHKAPYQRRKRTWCLGSRSEAVSHRVLLHSTSGTRSFNLQEG